jgi:hypothetical protein
MKKTFHIEKLDHGFVVTESGKRTAISNHSVVIDNTKAALQSLMDNINKFGTSEVVVTIEVDYNPPKSV